VKILAAFALETEFAPWRKMHHFRPAMWGGARVLTAEIGGADLGVLLTGAGPRQAAREIAKVSWGDGGEFAVCISTGLAGGLRPQIETGSVLAARGVISANAGEDSAEDALESSAALVSFAGECGAEVVDFFFTAGGVISRAAEKRHLGLRAAAVEMESYEIFRVTQERGIPAVAVRAICDTAQEDLPLDMNGVFTEEGQVSLARVVGQLALHPASLPRLVKIGQQSKRAAESLAKFLEAYVKRLAGEMKSLDAQAAASAQ
jgi:adenosylhomocysteine nucleosidase